MIISVPREVVPGETRVAVVPETVRGFVTGGLEVHVQRGAGARAAFNDKAYADAGATMVNDVRTLLGAADIVLKIHKPSENPNLNEHEVDLIPRGAVLICPLTATLETRLVQRIAEAGITSFALDAVPRIARAQSMDVLSSMASLSGYKAALMAADALGKILPMMMTAAGTIRASNALVIGAGVAGLQAIATARRLGAVVKAIDVRPAVKEQVESLGVKFIPMEVRHTEAETAGGYARDLGEAFYAREQEIIAPHLKDADIVITTAQIPGRRAPVLITREMVELLEGGSVIVDLAVEGGGNCSVSRPDEEVHHRGVTILAPRNLPARMPIHASIMFARNAATFLKELLSDGKLNIDMENEIIRATLITRDGQVVHEPTLEAIEAGKDQP